MRLSEITICLMAIAFSIIAALELDRGEDSTATLTVPRNGTAEEGIFQYSSENNESYPFALVTFVSGSGILSQPTALPTELPTPARFDPSQTSQDTGIYTGGPILTPGPTDIDTSFFHPTDLSGSLKLSEALHPTAIVTPLPEITISVKNGTRVAGSFATHTTVSSHSGNSTLNPNSTTGTLGITSPTVVSNTAGINSPTCVSLFLIFMIIGMGVAL